MAEAELVLVGALAAHFPAAMVTTETGDDLAENVPCIAVAVTGGTDDEVSTYDDPRIDFDCYHTSRAAARSLCYAVRAFLRNDLPGMTVAGGFVERVQSFSGPLWTPYANTDLRRFTYSARVRIKSL